MNLAQLFENANIIIKLYSLKKNFPFEPELVKANQLKKLKGLVVYTYENFHFYRSLMDDAGFDPYSLKSLDALKALPVITKDMYRQFTDSIVTGRPSFYKEKYHTDGTSGSTGMPLKVYRTWDERAYLKALFLRALTLNGYGIFDRTYWIVSPHRVLERDSIFQKFGIMPRYSVSYLETPENMLRGYQQSHPDILISNKSQLVQFALYVKEIGVEIREPKLCVSTAETLDNNSKRLIWEVFGKDNLVETYGSIECSTLAFQLKGNEFLYPCHDTSIIELDDNGYINELKGNCIVTDLHIHSFPLIRYQLGDWIEMEESNGLPVIKSIRGRMDDWITWKDGSKIPFHFFYEVMERRTEISQFRIIQENYDLVRVVVVAKSSADKSEIERILTHDFRAEIRRDVTFKIEFAESIPPDPTGKLRMVVSNII